MTDQFDNDQNNDKDQNNGAAEDLFAELEGLRASRQAEAESAASNDDVRHRLDGIADAAGSGRPNRKSARSAVSNRGTTFEDFVSATFDEAPAGDDAEAEADETDAEDTRETQPASRPGFSGLFSAAQTSVNPEPVVNRGAPGGLLFQAPQMDLAEPRDDSDDDEEPRGSSRRRDSGDSADDDSDTYDNSDDDSDGDSDRERSSDSGDGADEENRPRRRRGGRGRRGRSREGAAQGEEESGRDAADTSEPARDAGRADDDSHEDTPSNDSGSDDSGETSGRRRKRVAEDSNDDDSGDEETGSRRRRRRRSSSRGQESEVNTSEVTGIKGSTRMEAKRQRRREGREAGRRRPVITEAEFLARRESVDRAMVVRQQDDRAQIAVLEDGVCVEHYLSESAAQASLIGNVYLGKVQNVLPSMEAAFIDIGKGRNAVLYAGEVNWDAVGLEGQPRRIELALKPGDPVLVQVTKDPVGHKGARLTSQISLPGRFLVYVLGNSMTGISRKLPDTERSRLKKILKQVVPEDSGVIVRTAAEGASEDELTRDVERLSKRWESINKKANSSKVQAPQLLYGEPDLTIRIIRDVFNEDFSSLTIDGDSAWDTIHEYVESVAPDLLDRVTRFEGDGDIFDEFRVSEQIEKALHRKVNLPSGGSLVIDRTEAMTVVDVNTGRFTGTGGNLEETVTRNNLEAAEEVVRQLRLRDIGGIIVVDFIDMVLEVNRDLVLRRLVECLGRDRTRHQVAEVTSLGLVQMTRKRIGTGLAESLSAAGEDFSGRGLVLPGTETEPPKQYKNRKDRGNRQANGQEEQKSEAPAVDEKTQQASREAMAAIARATLKDGSEEREHDADAAIESAPAEENGRSGKGRKRSRRSRGSRSDGPAEAGSNDESPALGDSGGDDSAAAAAKTPEFTMPEPEEGVLIIAPRSEPVAEERPEPRRGRSRRRKSAPADIAAEPEQAAEAAPDAEPVRQPTPAQEPLNVPEPSGPAPMMIGLDATTRIQAAPEPVAPQRPAPVAEERERPEPEAATEKESAPPAPPVLMLGMTDD